MDYIPLKYYLTINTSVESKWKIPVLPPDWSSMVKTKVSGLHTAPDPLVGILFSSFLLWNNVQLQPKLLDRLELCCVLNDFCTWRYERLPDLWHLLASMLCVWAIWSGSNNHVYMLTCTKNISLHRFSSWPMTSIYIGNVINNLLLSAQDSSLNLFTLALLEYKYCCQSLKQHKV